MLKILTFIFLFPSLAFAILPFGQNKVTYRTFDWQILETDNFELYFYPEEEDVVREAAFMAERAYKKVTKSIQVYPDAPVLLFLYRNHPEFEQTNIISGYIGEGTGGFTEALKDRISLPLVSSPRRVEEVITHEFVHRIQFEVLYGGLAKSYRLLRSPFIPLWVMEGMAEYYAEDSDKSYTEMILRDAAISERLQPIIQLESFNHFDGREVVLMYKEAQSIFDYIAQNYGEDKIGQFMREYQKPYMTLNQAFTNTIGIGVDELNRKWLFYMKEKYWGQVQGKKDAEFYGNAVTLDTKDNLTFNIKPSFSPDGEKAVFLSDMDNYLDIYTVDLTNFSTKPLFRQKFESISSFGNAVSYSPNGKYLVFSAKANGKYYIYIYNIENSSIEYEENWGCDFVSSPSWLSDNERITFVGTKNGISDIYIANLKTKEIKQLTNDRYDDDYPVCSFDGKTIAYVSERNRGRGIYLINLDNNNISPLVADNFENISPFWNSDNKHIIFSSDRNGKYNLYIIDITDHAIMQVTDVRIGVLTPKFSYDGKRIIFSSFENGCSNIYIMDTPEFKKDKIEISQNENDPKGHPERSEGSQNEEGAYRKYSKSPSRPYEFGLSFDLIYLLFSYDTASGLFGGVYTSLSDLFGDHSIELMGDYLKDYHFGYQINYLCYKWRINFGASVFRWRTYVKGYDNDDNYITKYFVQDEGVSLITRYPLDRYYRVDLSFSAYNRIEEHFDGDSSSTDRVNSVGVSFVRDKMSWNIDEPIDNSAQNITVLRADNWLSANKRFTNVFTEHQYYWNVAKENVFAFRPFFGISTDTDRGVFVTGGGSDLRGYKNGEINGEKLLLLNGEFRFVLFKKIDFLLWPYNWLLIKKLKAAVFTDNGIAWMDGSQFSWSNFKNSVGVGLRLHTFLLESMPVILRFDIAKRTDSSIGEVYYIAIGHAF